MGESRISAEPGTLMDPYTQVIVQPGGSRTAKLGNVNVDTDVNGRGR